ncbi:fimbria/pilus periplasmic chaperone [Enterobacter asburiae]|jgi:P pilus assembly chaperone PapD|uniref:fimbria/pilus periplasmic chaperone n=1 Tax=Enterobacter asburiae TaxID=61645 RepID=UPI0018C32648|nr:fimbria/pilus periplasmic chaperone [Enterobacter asburiae]MBF9771257.1 fimbria/pilus periplasmic chaperone [Enterobacter asburiae]
MKTLFLNSLLSLLCLGSINSVYAEGIALGTTRIIYPLSEKQSSINVINTNKKETFLVQSWVSDSQGNKLTSFSVTPPLFVMKPEKANVIRIMYVGPKLPEDRESVFYFNNKAIPSVDKKDLKGNTLQIATQSIIKLFMRPSHLSMKSIDAPGTLRCQQSGNTITITNPSPYFVSLVKFSVGGKALPNNMVPPMGNLQVAVPENIHGTISFQTMNDYGAVTPALTCKA